MLHLVRGKPRTKALYVIDILRKCDGVKMADASSDDSSEFSFGYFENASEGNEIPDIGSDISVSPVSTSELSLLNSETESDSDDEDLAWRTVLRKPVNKPFVEPVGAKRK
jgi:hypothetical protein